MAKRKRLINEVDDCIEQQQLPQILKGSGLEEQSLVSTATTMTYNPPAFLSSLNRLTRTFFESYSCIELAKNLLGKLLVRKIVLSSEKPPHYLAARIVETEAYLGEGDKASHSYMGKRTNKNKAMFMAAGTAYVYSIHTYVCLNISACESGSAVLIRACEPVSGSEIMTDYRTKRRANINSKLPLFKFKELCNGPSKMCLALDITKEQFNQVDLIECQDLYLADDGFGTVPDADITACPRIGIANYAQEWTDKPLRFYITQSDFVSVKFREKKKINL